MIPDRSVAPPGERPRSQGGRPPWEDGGSFEGWTVPLVLLERARSEPQAVALREERADGYHSVTFAQLAEEVSRFAIGLIGLGVGPGDRVAIIGTARRELVVAELAIWAAHAISVGVYPTSAPVEILAILLDSQARVVVVETKADLERVLSIRTQLGVLDGIVAIDPPATLGANVVSYEALCRDGAREAAERPDLFGSMVRELDPLRPVSIVYTSGSTGAPKGVVHSNRTLLMGGPRLKVALVPELRQEEHRALVYLPLTHISPKITGVLLPLTTRLVAHFPRELTATSRNFREVAPTYLVQPPRFYEKQASEIVASLKAAPRWRRAAYALAMRIARATLAFRWKRLAPPPHLRALYSIARWVVFKPMLREVGYHRLKRAYIGSAPSRSDVVSLWHAWGLDLRESYGLTESAGNITAQLEPFPPPDNIGAVLPFSDCELRVAEDGELMFRGAGTFLGYWNQPEETARLLDDGWLRTGDLASIDAKGVVRITGRKKDLIKTTGGKGINPLQIEAELCRSPYLSAAIAIGEARKYVTALVELDLDAVRAWAEEHGLLSRAYSELAREPAVTRLAEDAVAVANQRLGRSEQVKYFRILPEPLAATSGVTALGKIQRDTVARIHADLIEAMYDESRPVRSPRP